MKIFKVVIFIICALMCILVKQVYAVQVKPVYIAGEERIYGVNVTTYMIDAAGIRSVKPLVKASAVLKYTVLNILADGSVKMRIDPVGTVLNGRLFNMPEQLGKSVTIKVNRYGKVIAVDVPATEYTSAKTIDLQPYMTDTWRKSSWIPEHDMKKGETWSYSKQNPNMDKSRGDVKIVLASDNEKYNGIECCRFDINGTSTTMLDEVMKTVLANPPKTIPQTAIDKCRIYAEGVTGQGFVSNNTQCWVSLADGGIIAASGKSRSSFSINTGDKLYAKQYSYTIENESRLQRISNGDIKKYLSVPADEKVDFVTESVPKTDLNESMIDKMKRLSNMKTYMSVIVGASVFDLLIIEGPLDFIDLSMKLHMRMLPDKTDYTNLKLSLGFKFGIDLPIIDFFSFFIGAGTNWGNLAESIKPGNVSPNISTALLFSGMNFSPSSAEIGLTGSVVKLGFGCNLSLQDINRK